MNRKFKIYLATAGLIVSSAIVRATDFVMSVKEPDECARMCEGLMKRNFLDQAEPLMLDFLKNHATHIKATKIRELLITCYQKQKKYDEALKAVNLFLELNLTEAQRERFLLRKGDVLCDMKKYREATEVLTLICNSADETIQDCACLRCAEALWQLGEMKNAIEMFSKLASKDLTQDSLMRRFSATWTLAQIYYRQGKIVDAATLLERLVGVTNSESNKKIRRDAYLQLVQIYSKLGEYDRALVRNERMEGEFTDEQTRHYAWRLRIQIYTLQKNFIKVVEEVREWQVAYPHDKDYQVFHCLGNAYLGLMRIEEALSVFRMLSENSSATQEIKWRFVEREISCLNLLDRYDEAIKLADRLLADAQLSVVFRYEFLMHKLYALSKQKKYKEIVSIVDDSVIDKSANKNYWMPIMNVYLIALTNLEYYEKVLETSLQLAKFTQGDERIAILLRAGEMARVVKKYEQAEQIYKGILAQQEIDDSTKLKAALELRNVYELQGKNQQAITLLQGMLAMGNVEEQAKVHCYHGFDLFKERRYGEAETQFKMSIAKVDRGVDATRVHHYLAYTYLELGKEQEALAEFATLYKQDSDKWPLLNPQQWLDVGYLFYKHKYYVLCDKICVEVIRQAEANSNLANEALLLYVESLIVQNSLDQAKDLLEKEVADNDLKNNSIRNRSYYVWLGEIARIQEQNDRAVNWYRKALNSAGNISQEDLSRVRKGLASVYYSEQDYTRASQVGLQAMVLDQVTKFTPQSMMIAFRSLIRLKEMEEAAGIWRELQTRFSLFAETQKSEPEVIHLQEWEKNKKN